MNTLTLRRGRAWISLPILGALGLFLMGGCGHHRCSHDKMGHYADKMTAKLAKKLDLNEEQKAKLDAMKTTAMEARSEMKKGRAENFESMLAMLRSDSFDEKKVNGWFDDKHKHMENTRKTMVGQFGDFHQSLSAEQREKLAELVEKKAGRWMKKK